MNRQTRTLIVLAVAIVGATVASYGVYTALARLPQRGSAMPTRKAVVAAAQMPVGTLLTPESVKLIDWPASTPLQSGFSTLDDVVNRGLVAAVAENEPLTESKLAPKGAGAGLPPTITQGMRAISVKVNEVIGVAGFVVPGTHVDVVTIINPGNSRNADDTISEVVVSNVQVLSAGTRYDQEEARKDGKAIRSTVVTLMVTPIDAERIALAQSEGELMLTLRHPLDIAPTETPGVSKAALFSNQPKKPEPAVTVKRRPAPVAIVPIVAVAPIVRPYTVETIRAAKRSEDKLAGVLVP